MKRIAIVLGTRPEAIKMSPVVRACEGSGAEWFMVHAGQGCSCDVDRVFSGGVGLPDAKDNPDVGPEHGGIGVVKRSCLWRLTVILMTWYKDSGQVVA